MNIPFCVYSAKAEDDNIVIGVYFYDWALTIIIIVHQYTIYFLIINT